MLLGNTMHFRSVQIKGTSSKLDPDFMAPRYHHGVCASLHPLISKVEGIGSKNLELFSQLVVANAWIQRFHSPR